MFRLSKMMSILLFFLYSPDVVIAQSFFSHDLNCKNCIQNQNVISTLNPNEPRLLEHSCFRAISVRTIDNPTHKCGNKRLIISLALIEYQNALEFRNTGVFLTISGLIFSLGLGVSGTLLLTIPKNDFLAALGGYIFLSMAGGTFLLVLVGAPIWGVGDRRVRLAESSIPAHVKKLLRPVHKPRHKDDVKFDRVHEPRSKYDVMFDRNLGIALTSIGIAGISTSIGFLSAGFALQNDSGLLGISLGVSLPSIILLGIGVYVWNINAKDKKIPKEEMIEESKDYKHNLSHTTFSIRVE